MRPLNQDIEQTNPENAEDEADILADQDQTSMAHLDANDENIGSDGTEEDFGLGSGDFARGEVDVKEQMDRTTAAMDASLHRPRDPVVTPYSEEGSVDTTEAVQSGMSNRVDPKPKPAPTLENQGHETGAFTDVGAGRSGVTRTH